MGKLNFSKMISEKVTLSKSQSVILYVSVYLSFWLFSPSLDIILPQNDFTTGKIIDLSHVTYENVISTGIKSVPFIIVFYIIIHSLGIRTSLRDIFSFKKKLT